MRIDKLTTKFQEALSDAQSLALGKDHAYIEPQHLLVALLKQDDGPKAILQRAGAQVPALLQAAEAAVARLPQVTGQDQVQVGPDLVKLLQAAEKEAIKRSDAFIAGELFMLALAESKSEAGRIAKEHGLNRKNLEVAIEAVRKESDESSQKRFVLIEEEIVKLKKEAADLEEIWRAEKSQAQGGQHVREQIDQLKQQIEELTRKGDFNKVAELQYGKLPALEKTLKEVQASGCRRDRRSRITRHRHSGV